MKKNPNFYSASSQAKLEDMTPLISVAIPTFHGAKDDDVALQRQRRCCQINLAYNGGADAKRQFNNAT